MTKVEINIPWRIGRPKKREYTATSPHCLCHGYDAIIKKMDILKFCIECPVWLDICALVDTCDYLDCQCLTCNETKKRRCSAEKFFFTVEASTIDRIEKEKLFRLV